MKHAAAGRRERSRRTGRTGPIGVAVVAAAFALALAWQDRGPQPPRALTGVAPASAAATAWGRRVYTAQCAACHGETLAGEPNWRAPLASGLFPAPPLDGAGHGWHHADPVLFAMIAIGPGAVSGGRFKTAMPAFADTLSATDIWAVLTFMEGRWPEEVRAKHAAINASYAAYIVERAARIEERRKARGLR